MTVFVIQDQMRWSHEENKLVPKFNLSPAKEYGELQFLLSPSAAPFNTEAILKELSEKLSEFTDEDYLLLVGNPAIIGMATALAANVAGTVNFLQWSGKDKGYIVIKADIFIDEK